MNAHTKSLIAEVAKLAPEEKIELIDEVLATLEPDQAALDQLWIIEIEDRMAAYRRGEITGRNARDVLAELQRE